MPRMPGSLPPDEDNKAPSPVEYVGPPKKVCLRCRFGFHKWMTLNTITDKQLLINMIHNARCKAKRTVSRKPTAPTPPPPRAITTDAKYFTKRVCLRCGQVEDTIEPERRRLKKLFSEHRLELMLSTWADNGGVDALSNIKK